MNLFKRLSLSQKVVWLLCLCIIITRLLLPFENVLSWDVFGYYLYLPAKFIYHDEGLHDMSWLNKIMNTYSPSSTLYQVNILADGHGVMRYPCGEALLVSPFFFIGHIWAIIFHFPADGFSAPYRFFYAIGGVVYSVIGIYYFRKILLNFFDEKLTALILVFIVAGTNLFEQTTLQNTLTHNFLFTLYSVLIYNTIMWHRDFKKASAFLIGLSIGLITITRANELVCLLIPLLWNVYDKESIKNKLQLITRQPLGILILISGIAIGLFPQLLYWKMHAGQWFYYSYDDPGVGFEFASPFIIEYLFSFRKGWFIYTPLMIFAIAGFVFLYRNNRKIFWPVTFYFIVNLYIVSSWSIWWYAGGSFSSRSLVSSYALMALPFGYFLQQFNTKWLKGIFAMLLLLNLFQTWQSSARIISNERMTSAYYFRIFGKTSVTDDDKKLLLIQRPTETIEIIPENKNFQKTTLLARDYEDETDKQRYADTLSHQGRRSMIMDSSYIFTPAFKIAYNQLTSKEYAWIRVSAWMFAAQKNRGEKLPMIVVNFVNQKGENYKYRTSGENAKVEQQGKWIKVRMDYMTPEVRNSNDELNIYLWYKGKEPVFVDDFTIEKFEE